MPTNLAPNRSRRPPPLLFTAILALAMQASHCLAQAPEAATYRIAGHIVSATNAQPLQRATVQILHSKTYKSEASTVSGEDGSFAFTNLKPGAYVLEGDASGYITSRYDAHGGYSTAIITGAGVDTESLVLKLTPDADISGRVTDEAGDPVRHANMALYRESYDTGKARTTRVGFAQTDATGTYDIAHLAPGKYFLSATATPWYAVHPQAAMQPGPGNFQYLMPAVQSPVGVVDAIDPSLDVAYPMTFYADATDSSAATPIILKGGDQPQLDIRLTPQTAVTITIPFASGEDVLDPGRTAESQALYRQTIANRPQFQLQRQVFDSLEPVNDTQMRGTAASYTYVGIPPGQYVLKQMNSQGGAALKSTTINLTEQSTQIDPSRGEALGDIKLLLKTADGAKLPPQSTIELIREPSEEAGSHALDNKGEAEFKGLQPGEYSLRPFLGNKEYFVTRITSDGKTLPGTRLQVTGATQSVTVTAGPASATLQGFAKTDGKPAPGVLIILLPADQANRTGDGWKDQSDLDGSFTLSNIPPGRYILLAIQDGWDLEWQREEVLAHYLPLAVPVTIPTTANAALKLPDPVPVQPR